jgi:glycosyltransferase involved in cell wall biosynthesis
LLGLPEHAFVVGFVGRLDPCKDLPHLIRACARPDVISKDDRLLLVGTGPDQRRVTEAVMQMGMADRIVLAGNCAGEKLHAAYAAMDAFVLPSLYEGYGMVVLEAMAGAGCGQAGRRGIEFHVHGGNDRAWLDGSADGSAPGRGPGRQAPLAEAQS